ncbi:EML1_2 [Mytilus coruscus]|uniref:EML1_2 n=1 Tax=Mytilus coruscus TaxID=42192 RepID=A0A6J8EZD1_MYTCO|nr:EML1_2 [Mytilus coruscus]
MDNTFEFYEMGYNDGDECSLEDNYLGSKDSSDSMPLGQSQAQIYNRNADKKIQRNQNQKKNGSNDNRALDRKRGKSPYNPPLRKPKRSPQASELTDNNQTLEGRKTENVTVNAEDKTILLISENVSEYSRQRMRALQMSLRHYSNVDGRISVKELNLACQDNNIQLNSRVLQILQGKFEDQHGVNIEKLYQYLSEAHSRSGRDSVMAMRLRNDLEPHKDTNQEEKDADLLRRLEELLVKDNTFFDIEALRLAFQLKDKQKTGKISNDEVFDIVALKQQPLYGALLKALVKRCDMDNHNIVSWPEFLSFLEKAQKNAWKKYPEMSSLPELMKSKTPVVPEASDILSNQTKSRLVNRLLKKGSINRGENLNKKEKSEKSEEENKENETKEKLAQHEEMEEQKENEKSETIPQRENQESEKETTDEKPEDTQKPALLKTPSGFLGTFKSFIAGRKKDEEESEEKIELKEKSTEKENTNSKKEERKNPDKENNQNIDQEEKTESDKTQEVSPRDITLVKDTDNSKKDLNTDSGSNENQTEGCLENPKTDDITDNVEEMEKEVPKLTIKDSGCSDGDNLTLTKNGHTIEFSKPVGYDTETVKLEPPEARLKLDWVYGYRGNDCRNNIHVLANGELVYFISNIVVLYDKENHKQRHYKEHTEYIKCIALHSNGVTIATGQVCSKHRPHNKPHIRIWRSDTLQTTHVLEEFEKSVMCLAFSNSEDILAAVDNTPDKRLTIWNISSGELITETEVNTELICDISFNKKYPELLVSSGKEHLQWWKIYEESRTLQPVAQPQYDNYLKAKFIIFLEHNEKGDLVTGDSNGTIYVWADGGNKITNFVKHAHDGPVFVVMFYKNYIISGGRDGIVYCWLCNKNMDNVGELQIPRSEGGIRMLQFHDDTFFIGTTMNSMLSAELSTKGNSPLSGIQLDPVPITQGHYDDLRGLVVMHESQLGGDFLTAGTDGVVCWFNTERRDPVCKLMLKGMQFTCVDSSFDGTRVVLGTKNGNLVILNIEGESSSEVFNNKITKDRIDCVRFSPDYTIIAVGGHDCSIHMYHFVVKSDGSFVWEMKGKCVGHRDPVVDIDFSADLFNDHFLLRSCTNSPENLYWNAQSLDEMDMTECREVSWMTEKCRISASNIGLWWSKLEQEGDINCVDVCTESNLIVMGDSYGNVCLYRYPCDRKGMYCHMYHGHAAVHNVSFSRDGHYVISVGGKDSCVIQWKIV